MKKKRSLLDSILYYHVIQFLIFAIVLFFVKDYIVDFLCYLTNITEENNILYGLERLTVYLGLPVLWIYFFFNLTRNRRYFDLVGRSYGKDKKYNRTFSELVEYFEDAEPQKMDFSNLPVKTWKESNGLIFGKVQDKDIGKERLVCFEPYKNGIVSMVWGAPGDGKTSSNIIPSARQFGLKIKDGKRIQKGAVMVTDLKGDIYEANKKYRRIKRFSTINWKKSYHYDPLVIIRNLDEDSRCDELDNLSVTIIPPESGSDAIYFVNTARAFFTGIIMYILKENINMSFPDICLAISTGSFSDWGEKIEKSGYVNAMKYTNRFKTENPKNVGGGYSKLCDCLNLYTTKVMRTLLNNDDKCISPDDLENCTDVYVQVDPNKMAKEGGPIIALLYQVFMSKMLYRDKNEDGTIKKAPINPPIAFIIDEFGQIPAMPVLSQSAALLRGYNCSIMLSCQSLAMIEEKYGDKGRKILVDCAKAHCFLSINDPDTREWASRLIGTRKILKISNSTSKSKNDTSSNSVNPGEERCVKPEHFGLLPDDDSLIIYYKGHYVKGKKTYYFGDIAN